MWRCFELLDLVVAGRLHAHVVVVGLWHRADQLVELELRGDLLAALRVVQQEQHHQGDDPSNRGEH